MIADANRIARELSVPIEIAECIALGWFDDKPSRPHKKRLPWSELERTAKAQRLADPYEWHTDHFASIAIGYWGARVRLSPSLAMNRRLANQLGHLALFQYGVRNALAFDWTPAPTSTAKGW